MFKNSCLSLIIFGITICLSCNLSAYPEYRAETNNSSNEEKFSITPYVLYYDLNGRINFENRGVSTPIDLSFSDLSENPAIGIESEALYEKFKLHFDIEYQSFVENGQENNTGTKYKVDLLEWFYDLGASSRWYAYNKKLEYGLTGAVQTIFYDIDVTELGATTQTSHDDIVAFPYVGVYYAARTSEKDSFHLRVDYSNFGSDLNRYLNVVFQIRHKFLENISGVIGYKHRSLDYKNGSVQQDFEVNGAIIGVNAVF